MTLTRRRKKLDEMTKGDGLGNAYAATLSRIKSLQRGRSKLGMEVLMWVSHAERPLHVDELRHALGVEGSIDLDIGNIPAIETLLACSLGLVTVEKSSSTVRLVHYSLQEYPVFPTGQAGQASVKPGPACPNSLGSSLARACRPGYA